jgi:HAD superfamily hydrolase (TIGR01509 family)
VQREQISTPPPGLDAIVFDLDGVLVDSESVWDGARRAIVAEAGGSWSASATTDMMGMSAPEWSRYLRDELGVPLEPEEINERVVAKVLAEYRHEVPTLPGAIEAVRRLADRWPLGIASSANRPVIDTVLERTELTDCFAVTVSGDEVARGKPAPDVYLEAAKKLRVDPESAAAVEDSSNGLRAAAAAEMFVIAVPNREFPPAGDALALANLVVGSLDELTPEVIVHALSAD